MKKIKLNNVNLKKLLLIMGVGVTITYSGFNAGFHIDNESHLPSFYYINIEENVSNQDFLNEVNNIIDSNAELKDTFSLIREDINSFLLEKGQDINQERFLKMLKNLDITYNDDMNDIYATTYFFNDTIEFSNRFNYKSDDQKKEIVEHEFFHLLFGKDLYGSSFNFPIGRLGLGLDEGFAQKLTEEQGSATGIVGYHRATYYVGAVCELIGEDKFFEDVDSNNVWKLIGDLSEYGNVFESYKLLSLINKNYYSNSSSDSDVEAWNIIENMYEKKNGVSLENSDDAVMKLYGNKIAYRGYKIDGVSGYSDISKNYFVNTDKEPCINLLSNNEIVDTIYLNDDNSLKTNSISK